MMHLSRDPRTLVGLALIALLALPSLAGPPQATSAVDSLDALGPVLGPWREVMDDGDPGSVLLVERQRTVWKVPFGTTAYVKVGRVLAVDGDVVSLRLDARVLRYRVSLEAGCLHLRGGGEHRVFEPLATVPPGFDIAPLDLPAPKPLAPARIQAIREELAQRKKVDQLVRKDDTQRHRMEEVDAANTAWLKELIQEVGWIDATRFGSQAAHDAFLLVQHSGDIPLMRAALLPIEKDLRAGRLKSGDPYALLYDRLQLRLGHLQRYGSQVEIRGPHPHVPGLEDPERVDEWREEIGMIPLDEYLEVMSEHFLDGEPISRTPPQP